MVILERNGVLQQLEVLLQEAAAGQGRLVLVGGEAGVGKTTLIQHFCRVIEGRAERLVGACDPLSTPRPLGPLLDVSPLLGGNLEHLLDSGASREQLFRTLLALLASGARPTVLVFEDVHWADEATLDLLRFLGRRLASIRALLIATFRDDEVGARHPLRVVLGDLATSRATRRVMLPPLSKEAVRVLAEGTPLDPSELYHRTGGNPFFVTEVLASGSEGVPVMVRDAVLARAARLSPAAQTTLKVAAVIGARVEPSVLALVAGADHAPVEECIALGVLYPQGDALAFRHELARETILQTLSPQHRIELDRAVLLALQSLPPHPDRLAALAHHAEAAHNREAVLTYAPQAARRAVQLRAHREAAAQYARALRFVQGMPVEEHAALLEERSYECYLTDQLDDAVEARLQALAIWRKVGDPLKEGENLRWLSRLNWFLGNKSTAEAYGRAALDVLTTLAPGSQLAMAYSNQAQLRMLADDLHEAITWGEQAIELAVRLDDTETHVHALNNVGTARLKAGDAHGKVLLERSCTLARQLELEEHVARALTNLGSFYARSYQLDLADHYLDEGIAYTLEHDLDSWRLYMLGWRAVSLVCQGRWDEAAAAAHLVLGHPQVSMVSRVQALVALGRIRARRGDPEVAAVLDEALELAARTGELQRLGPVRAARAEAAWLRGDLERARAEAHAVLGLALARGDSYLAGELAVWLWRSGESPPADMRVPALFALMLTGKFTDAAEEWQRLRCPYEAALVLSDSLEEPALRHALEIFENLGARPCADRVAQRLRQLGVRAIPRGPRPETRANPAQLTRRELEIAGLVAAGLRNAEIAQRLHLSAKTVDHHVSAVLSKLGVDTRTEVAYEAARRGLMLQNGETIRPK